MANPNPNPAGRFKKGQSGNPGGTPEGTRKTLSAAFLKAVIADFNENGATALAKLRDEKPDRYCELIAGLLPKESDVTVNHSGVVAHEHRSVSETAQWLAGLLGAGQGRPPEEPLPN